MPESDQSRQFAVIGDLMLDVSLYGDAHRLAPEAPVPVVLNPTEVTACGGAANVAANLAALSGDLVYVVGQVAHDSHGYVLHRLLSAAGVCTDHVKYTDGRTTVKTRLYANARLVARTDFETTVPPMTPANGLPLLVDHVDTFVFSDYGKSVFGAATDTTMVDMIRLVRARRPQALVVIDPKVPRLAAFDAADVITPNWLEAHAVARLPVADPADDAAADRVATAVAAMTGGRPAVFVKRGRYGVTVRWQTETRHVRAPAVSVYDVQGAGDTFVAALAAVLGGRTATDMHDAAAYACAAAAEAVATPGTAVVSREAVARRMARGGTT